MCGIVGGVAQRDVVPILVDGLRRLEYRGYDSAGVAVLNESHQLKRARTAGKVRALEALLSQEHLSGTSGIAHTRWATHGKPDTRNAHPHICRETVAVVHNGIIENHEALRVAQTKAGYVFTSETDTEVIAHQIYDHLSHGADILQAVQRAARELEGAYAIGVISKAHPQRLVAARRGSPLVIGVGKGENFIGSQAAALISVTQRFIYLEDGDVADITCDAITIYDADGKLVERPVHLSSLTPDAVEKGRYRHYMLKEIFEQTQALADTLTGCLSGRRVLEESFGPQAKNIFDQVQSVLIVACGTSFHAGSVARYWLESIAGIPCVVEVASEFRYRKPVLRPNSLIITISQSGETADTLAALQEAKRLGFGYSLSICNVPESALVRASDLVFLTRAGPEIGVASTKAFTTQLAALMLLTVCLGRRHGLTAEKEAHLVTLLSLLPAQVDRVLKLDPQIKTLAERFADKHNALFLGRGTQYPVAMEGALKLKEISYIHAEAYPAGELKHGPLALVDADMPVIAVAPNNELLEKLKSNLQEVRARGGELYVFADETIDVAEAPTMHVIKLPHTDDILTPIVFTIPLQLLAYHVAVLKGTDVDQPRNLAKSVTVE